MGAVSSCCSAEPAENKETIEGTSAEASPLRVKEGSYKRGGENKKDAVELRPPAATKAVSDADVENFKKRLEASLDVIVLLADGTRLTCQLKLNMDDHSLTISCDTNLRVIPLSELKAILHGRDQLRRVETKANLVDDPNCVALHMMTGNCIPVRFDVIEDKNAFIELITKIK